MTYERFEDLPVWNAAQELAVDVYSLVERACFDRKGDLRNQLQRASLSVSNNIAEGFERGTTNELIAFLYIARGSAGETRSALRFAERLAVRGVLAREQSDIADVRSEISRTIPQCESVSRQLQKWAEHLQNTDIRGPRHLTDASRELYQRAKRADAFQEKLRRIREGDKPEEI